MSTNRVPAGATAGGVGIGGQFARSSGRRPVSGNLTTMPQNGSFLYPPASFASKGEYVEFWKNASVSDTILTKLVKAREKWRVPQVKAARDRLVSEWESQKRIRRMAKKDPGFYAVERAARENASGPEKRFPPLSGELARPIAVAHQIWSKTHLVPGMTQQDVHDVTVAVPGDPNVTVEEIVTDWRTDEWAGFVLGSSAS